MRLKPSREVTCVLASPWLRYVGMKSKSLSSAGGAFSAPVPSSIVVCAVRYFTRTQYTIHNTQYTIHNTQYTHNNINHHGWAAACTLWMKKEIGRLKAPLCGIYVNKKKVGLFILLSPD